MRTALALLALVLWQLPSAPTGLRVGNKMALTLGTNAGFVLSAPSIDPDATAYGAFDYYGFVIKDTVPATALKITEVGFWVNNATEAANFRAGLYDNDGAVVPGEAGTRIYLSGDVAKGTDAGWKKVTVDWDVSAYANTVVWIAIGLDNTATATVIDRNDSGGPGFDTVVFNNALPNPFGGGALIDSDGLLAIYAVYTASGGATPINATITDDGNLCTEALEGLYNYHGNLTDTLE